MEIALPQQYPVRIPKFAAETVTQQYFGSCALRSRDVCTFKMVVF